MNNIANGVIKFCKRYQNGVVGKEVQEMFQSDYAAIGEVLSRRVRLEEEFYMFYQP